MVISGNYRWLLGLRPRPHQGGCSSPLDPRLLPGSMLRIDMAWPPGKYWFQRPLLKSSSGSKGCCGTGFRTLPSELLICLPLKYMPRTFWRFPIPIGTKCGKYGDSAQTLVRLVKGASAAPYRLGVFPIDLLVMSQREILQGSESLTNTSPMQTRTHGDSRCRWKQGKRMKSGPLCEALTVPNKATTTTTNKHLRCGNRKGPLGRTDQTHHRMDPTQWLPDHQLKQY